MPSLKPHTELTSQVFNLMGTSAEQLEYATRIADSLDAPDPARPDGGEITLLEAGTGVGKGRGYLTPLALNAVLTGERSMIATHSNHLAKQLLEDDAPAVFDLVEQITGRRPTIAHRVGKRNFVDLDRVADLIGEMLVEGKDPSKLRKWADAEPATFVQATDEMGLTLPEGVTQEDISINAGSSRTASRAYLDHKDLSSSADIVITNHAMALIDAQAWGRALIDAGQRPIKIAVFDEADTLPGLARNMAQGKIALAATKALTDAVPAGPQRDDLREALRALRDCAETRVVLGEVPIIGEGDALLPLVEALRDAARAAARVVEDDPDLREDLRWLAADLADWVAAASGHPWKVAALAASAVKARPSLVIVATNPARILARLWRRPRDGRDPFLRSVVFTSATLATPTSREGDFTGFMTSVGVSPAWSNFAASWTIEAPAGFGSMSFMLADRSVPVPFKEKSIGSGVEIDQDWLAYVARAIGSAQGRRLVLAASYADVDLIGAKVPGALVHERGTDLMRLIEEFKGDPNAVLISPAAWSGVSLPGMIDHLIIPRLPFGAPDETRQEVLIKAMEARGIARPRAEGILFAERKADLKRKLRQGIGRLIRRPTDKGVVWILDPRFPLPDAMIRDRRRRIYQGAAKGRGDLVAVLPPRFRRGVRSAFEQSKIFSASEDVQAA